MTRKRIPIRMMNLKPGRSKIYLYFKKPLNSILFSILVAGILLTVVSHSFHPTFTAVYQQGGTYTISRAGNVSPAFVIFPNQTIDIQFTLPSNATVFYNIWAYVTIKVSPSVEPTGKKTIYMSFALGDANDSKNISISGKDLPFAISTMITLISVSGGTYEVTVSAKTNFTATLDFSPLYAVAGLALSTGSLIVIATVSGTKSEEL